jgi:hypothetical protein
MNDKTKFLEHLTKEAHVHSNFPDLQNNPPNSNASQLNGFLALADLSQRLKENYGHLSSYN